MALTGIVRVALSGMLVGGASLLLPACHRQPIPAPDRSGTSQRAIDETTDSTVATPAIAGATQNARAEFDDTSCAECHPGIAASFAAHPMGLSAAPVADATRIEQLDADGWAEFTRDGYQYRVEVEGDRMWHARAKLSATGRPLDEQRYAIAWAVGFGRHGRSYLIDHGGQITMSPITWYADRDRWDLSPGYDQNNLGFQRTVVADCLFCHANRVEPVAGTMNAYRQPVFYSGCGIRCSRCHGPGADHVTARKLDSEPLNASQEIVNPARLDPVLRDDVCRQCHVAGAARVERRNRTLPDFRPGQPLEESVRLFVLAQAASEEDEFVGEFEQLVQSVCYQASQQQLGCISCHDPHEEPPPAERVAYYRAKCLECHRAMDCGLAADDTTRAATGDSCYQCHMPRRDTNLQHVASRNHRILAQPETSRSAEQSLVEQEAGVWEDDDPLRVFPPRWTTSTPHLGSTAEPGSRRDPQPESTELVRDHAVAIVATLASYPERIERRHLVRAVRDLTAAVVRDPDDMSAWSALAEASLRTGQVASLKAALNTILQRVPHDEYASATLATVYQSEERWNDAERLLRQLSAAHLHRVRYRFEWAYCLSQLGQWDQCRPAAEAAAAEFPDHVGIRQLLVASYLQEGRLEDAERVYQEIVALDPEELPIIRQWYLDHPLRQGTAVPR